MVDQKLGSLVAQIIVDGGLRPHYGARDSVTGKVVLEYVSPGMLLTSLSA